MLISVFIAVNVPGSTGIYTCLLIICANVYIYISGALYWTIHMTPIGNNVNTLFGMVFCVCHMSDTYIILYYTHNIITIKTEYMTENE